LRLIKCALLGALLCFVSLAADVSRLTIPITYYQLPNGLKVALSRDTTAPLTVVAVYYNIGFRIEPKDRTGFAHLFEHMMFQGSANLGKMEFIKLVQSNGGVLNGSTRFDFTNYYEVVPSNKLETMLWAEADRMKGLAITEENLANQKGVVSNEVKVNVINQPYGGFPWLDMPQYAHTNWYNAHNFYGDLKDIEAATLADVKSFFKTYYAPNNAALAIVGDFDEAQTKGWIEKYFGSISRQPAAQKPDLAEPRQAAEKRFSKVDKLAKKPALAVAYQMPSPRTPDHYAMVMLDQVLLQGEDSLLNQELAKKKGYTERVAGGINLLGNAFNYNGPMLWMTNLTYDNASKTGEILDAIDHTVSRLQDAPVAQADLDRALVKYRASLYRNLTQLGGLGRADLMASFALFIDNPDYINQIEPELRKVTPAALQKVAQNYLRKSNRTILTVEVAQ